jgi:hypothetical protein
VIITQIPRYMNKETNQKRKQWFLRIKENLGDRPLLKLIWLLFIPLGWILLIVFVYVFAAGTILLSLFLAIGSIEYFKTMLQNLPWLTRMVTFGFSSVGWIGFLSGIGYLLSYPKGITMLTSAFMGKFNTPVNSRNRQN